MKKWMTILILAAMALTMLSACGKTAEEAPVSGGPGIGIDEETVAALEASTKADNHLDALLTSEPSSLDCARFLGIVDRTILHSITEPLTRIENGIVTEAGAESFEVSEDGLVYTFHLRENHWSDGVPVTANDYVCALLRESDPANAWSFASDFFCVEGFEEPPATAAFLLLGENPGAFLPTVRSRCLTLNLAPGAEETGDSPVAAALCEAWLKGDALAFLTAAFPCEKYEREKFDGLVADMVTAAALRARAAQGEGRQKALILTEKLEKLKARHVSHLQEKRNGKTEGTVVHDQHGRPCSEQSFRKLWDAVRAREEHEGYVYSEKGKERRMLRVGEKIAKHNITIELDFHPTPHMLRHTYITRLILSGANIKTVQYLAGHASVQLTLDIYTHLTANRPEDTQAAVLAAFGGT